MSRDLVSRADLSHTVERVFTANKSGDANMRRVQASPLSIWSDPRSCQRDIDCQRLSAAMALTVCPVSRRLPNQTDPYVKAWICGRTGNLRLTKWMLLLSHPSPCQRRQRTFSGHYS